MTTDMNGVNADALDEAVSAPPRLDDPNFENLTEHIQGQLKKLEELPYPKVQQDVFELLNCLDLMHREVFTRLIELIETSAPHIKLDMANDYAIQSAMMLYGFVQTETPSAQPNTKAGSSVLISLDAIPITEPPPMTMPIWIPAGNIAELQPGALRAAKIEGREVLICRIGDELFGLDNHGLDSILPLDRAVLTGYLLRDPWHHVDYDVRTGEIQDGSKLSVETYPIVIGKDGKFRIGFNISKKATAFLAQTRRGEPNDR